VTALRPGDARKAKRDPWALGLHVCRACQGEAVQPIREEFRRLRTFEERHRRLLARLVLILVATLVVDLCGAVAMFLLERHASKTEVVSFGDALFFSTVQLLTVSSQLKNPLTPAGKVVDVFLELWAVIVVAGSAGAIASFFQSGDRP
jgi:Ion channel